MIESCFSFPYIFSHTSRFNTTICKYFPWLYLLHFCINSWYWHETVFFQIILQHPQKNPLLFLFHFCHNLILNSLRPTNLSNIVSNYSVSSTFASTPSWIVLAQAFSFPFASPCWSFVRKPWGAKMIIMISSLTVTASTCWQLPFQFPWSPGTVGPASASTPHLPSHPRKLFYCHITAIGKELEW